MKKSFCRRRFTPELSDFEDDAAGFWLPAHTLDLAGRTVQVTASGMFAGEGRKAALIYFGAGITASTGFHEGRGEWRLQLQVHKTAVNEQIGFHTSAFGKTGSGISLPLYGAEAEAEPIPVRAAARGAEGAVTLQSLIVELLN